MYQGKLEKSGWIPQKKAHDHKAIVFKLSLTSRVSGIQIKHKFCLVLLMSPSLALTQEPS